VMIVVIILLADDKSTIAVSLAIGTHENCH
jgi:hypothetical protein